MWPGYLYEYEVSTCRDIDVYFYGYQYRTCRIMVEYFLTMTIAHSVLVSIFNSSFPCHGCEMSIFWNRL